MISCVCIVCARCSFCKIKYISLRAMNNVKIGKLTVFKGEVKLWKTKNGGGGKTASARFQASAAMKLRPSFVWDVIQRTLVVVYRRFGTTYRVLSSTVKRSKNNAGKRVDSLLYRVWCERKLDLWKVKEQIRLPRPGSMLTLQQRG